MGSAVHNAEECGGLRCVKVPVFLNLGRLSWKFVSRLRRAGRRLPANDGLRGFDGGRSGGDVGGPPSMRFTDK